MRAVARKLGVNQGNFPGKVARGLDANTVLDIARAYGINVIQALVDTGHIHMDEAPQVVDAQITEAIDNLIEKYQSSKRIADSYRIYTQADYGLVADTSPEEGDGTPDDYEP